MSSRRASGESRRWASSSWMSSGVALRLRDCMIDTLTTCQRRPSTRWGEPARMSPEPMLTTRQPMATAALIARLRFSVTSKTESGWSRPRWTQRMSMVSPSPTWLISLHSSTPSLTVSKISVEPSGIGSKWAQSSSPESTSLMWRVNAIVSDSANECVAPKADLVTSTVFAATAPPAGPCCVDGRRSLRPPKTAAAASLLLLAPWNFFVSSAGDLGPTSMEVRGAAIDVRSLAEICVRTAFEGRLPAPLSLFLRDSGSGGKSLTRRVRAARWSTSGWRAEPSIHAVGSRQSRSATPSLMQASL
mmetsp:Transcript_85877/g.257255  ORF Transcript_85877/g.257255 Transcript_85877/m.257255 type:complete len:303 (-) Transcript_85877:403-1311(-)